ncbi:hypothetical protein CAC42_5593 [Sphaceloma murrayae]|uniref:Uncharacterized protein n=1 Tax=Sphaceloma murrayae TaxID=2082308 RepID=A0A2K1QYZ8_9PEZI|nr:hypothetical protein CAC42_5593 [Sphaceloma murrayae]
MAAAHLANELPGMKKEGLELHRQASEHLGKELVALQSSNVMNDQPLLTLLLLGMSACWQRPGDLGLPFLRTARSFLRSSLRKKNSSSYRPLLQMFEEAMIYWEMVTSFVATDADIDVLQAEKLSQLNADNIAQHEDGGIDLDFLSESDPTPHPWTGISPESQILLGQVGKLVYAARTQSTKSTDYRSIAVSLEESLLSLSFPSATALADSGDMSTRPADFIILAEVTRDCGLLELYRVFPTLLARRLPQTPSSPTPLPTSLSGSSSEHRSWLTSFACHILTRLESIPATSHIRVHQLLPLVIAGSELRFMPKLPGDPVQFESEDRSVYQARRFVRSRLHRLEGQLPAQPVKVILQLLGEVWERLDGDMGDEEPGVFWIDVMVEKGWWTLMG